MAYLGNLAGALIYVGIVYGSGLLRNSAAATRISSAKVSRTWGEMVARGGLCPWVVGKALWLATAAASTSYPCAPSPPQNTARASSTNATHFGPRLTPTEQYSRASVDDMTRDGRGERRNERATVRARPTTARASRRAMASTRSRRASVVYTCISSEQ